MTSYRKFIIKSDELKGTGFVSPIAVTIVDENGDASLLVPKKARLLINNAETGEVQSVTLQLHNVTVDPGEISETHQEEKEIHALQVDSLLLRPVVSKSIQEVLERAATHDSPTISNAVLTLQNNVIALNNHVVGRISQRWAVSLIPFLAVILSCLLAIRYSNLMPLAVYAKVFAPTIIVMLLIFSGGNMIRDNNVFAGFSIMWISISVFLGLIIFHWSKLRVM
jgi:hypothetical protein